MKEELFIKMVLDAWHTHIKYTDDLFNSLSDEELFDEVAPGRNRAIYLLGHLAAVHDRMLSLIGFEEPHHHVLYKTFVENTDKAITALPRVDELRNCWKEINEILSKNFSKLSPPQWFERHTAVSEADFAKEPYRNKLNIVISRTNHLASHLGQLRLLKLRRTE